MQIDWFTFIAQIVNFLILIGLLRYFLYKPVIKAMDKREQTITSELEEARLKKVEADQKERQLEQKLKTFEDQKSQLLDEARREVNEKRTMWIDELRTEVAGIKKRWVEAIESEQDAFLMHLKEETGQQIIDLINRVLTDLSERNLEQQTLDFYFEKLSRLNQQELEELRKTLRDLDIREAKIYSSFELDSRQKQKLGELLRQASGTELSCEFDTSKELGFGIETRIEGWRLSWNLKTYLETLSREMDRFFKDQSPLKESTGIK